MCKICENCNGVMNYDPYFEAEICSRCGKIERVKPRQKKRRVSKQEYKIESIKEFFVMSTAR